MPGSVAAHSWCRTPAPGAAIRFNRRRADGAMSYCVRLRLEPARPEGDGGRLAENHRRGDFRRVGVRQRAHLRQVEAELFHLGRYTVAAHDQRRHLVRAVRQCTELAPTGSSIRSFPSMKNTAIHTRTPATPPIRTAEGAVTKAQGAVIATRPASVPFAIMEGSGLPNLLHM